MKAAGPDTARRLSAAILIPLVLFAALALLPLAAQFGPKAYILSLGTRLMIFALAAISLDLILGYGGMVSFGHAAFLGIGGYAAGILVDEGRGDLLLALPLAMAASALFAAATGYVSIRTRGVAFIMITLAFAQMAYFFANTLSAYGGSDGLSLLARSGVAGLPLMKNDTAFFYVVLAILALAFGACRLLVASPFGQALEAVRQNPGRMAAMGYDTDRIKLIAYAISGTLCGVAGFLLANQTEFVSPSYMAWQRSGELIAMVVLGGMGTLHGALLGAVAFLALEEILSDLTPHWRLVFGPILILVVLMGRGGLVGLIGRMRR